MQLAENKRSRSFLIEYFCFFFKKYSIRIHADPCSSPVTRQPQLLETSLTRIKSILSRFLIDNFRPLLRTATRPLLADHSSLVTRHCLVPSRFRTAIPFAHNNMPPEIFFAFIASIVAFPERSVYVLRRSNITKREQILFPQRIANTRTYFKQMENA
jgi:hypothetical protein